MWLTQGAYAGADGAGSEKPSSAGESERTHFRQQALEEWDSFGNVHVWNMASCALPIETGGKLTK